MTTTTGLPSETPVSDSPVSDSSAVPVFDIPAAGAPPQVPLTETGPEESVPVFPEPRYLPLQRDAAGRRR